MSPAFVWMAAAMNLHINELDPSIRFHEVELIPAREYPLNKALPFILSWLTQIMRGVKILIIRLCASNMAIAESPDWIQITELLRTRFKRVEQLIVRFLPPEPLNGSSERPKTSTLAAKIENQLGFFAQRGKL
ncbi:hypothetical protein CERSUDRAFT_92258 [Gelatoporia subvermispora B]|uniref:Uncharacterized protein n=1 Tax=Ceriporiopsis subvermispora (strain B) TaxID=914234 RepID=M2RMS3_CERS8|nr:hypothetical protein CERSUDRAFT_92258 [Gelatoporia subvermispora B]